MNKKFDINVRKTNFLDCRIERDERIPGTFSISIGEKEYTIDCGRGSDRFVIWEEDYINDGFARIVNWSYGHDDLCNEIEHISNFGFSSNDSLRDIVKAAPNTFFFLSKVFYMIDNRQEKALER